MAKFSTEVENKYQTKLQEQLKEMRADFDNRILQNRAEVDDLHKNKLAEANENLKRNRDAAGLAQEESSVFRMRVRELENSNNGKAALIENLNNRIQELDANLLRLREEMDGKIRQRDEQVSQLQNEISIMITDYQDLLDLKVQIDTELQAYHKLLEGEENR